MYRKVVWLAAALALTVAGCGPLLRAERLPATAENTGTLATSTLPAPTATAISPTTAPPPAGPLPVFPGAEGFGTHTPAGRGGEIYLVTTLADSGPGSLRACVEAEGPRVCLFEVSGEIRLQSDLVITNPYLTIAGQTAPSPGITVRDYPTYIQTHDVLIQHIRFRAGDAVIFDDPNKWGVHDALEVSAVAYNVVLDHNTFSWGIDETLSMLAANDITVSNSIIAEGLYASFHPKGPQHSKGLMVTNSSENISLLRNLIASNHDRNPMISGSEVEMVNNLVYNWVFNGASLRAKQDQQGHQHGVVTASLVGNVYLDGPNTHPDKLPVVVAENTPRLFSSESQIYIADLRRNDTAPADPWSLVAVVLADPSRLVPAASPAVWSNPTVLPSGEVEAYVLANVGARPADRDSADARLIEEVRTRRGAIINCVEPDPSRPECARNAGGWPVLAENYRPLDLPANPNGDDDGDGYTNLEEWLHEQARIVEQGE